MRDVVEGTRSRLRLEVFGKRTGLQRPVTLPDVYIPGLALTGYFERFPHQRIQVLGHTEVSYLALQDRAVRQRNLRAFVSYDIPCIIVAGDMDPPADLIRAANSRRIPVLRTPEPVMTTFHIIGGFLGPRFAPRTSVHASLVDVYGMGLLFTGRSGIGKSEIALDLVERRHTLVADDIVILRKVDPTTLVGSGTGVGGQFLEVRGLGILDVPRIYGVSSFRQEKRVEVEVRLEHERDIEAFERTGLDEETVEYLGVRLPVINLPIFPGKNITVIAETIALNQLAKLHGYHSAEAFNAQLQEQMRSKRRKRGGR